MSFSDYSATPSANTTIAGQNIAPGGPPSAVGPAIRQLMADARSYNDVGGKFTGTGTGEIAVNYRTLLQTAVDVRRFGALCDGVTDDTVAVQKAITACNTVGNATALLIPGPCLIRQSLMIDRPVTTKNTMMRIIGAGNGAGFYVDTPGLTLFDSTIAFTTGDPVSEKVAFENIVFEASNSTLLAQTVSKKFLRIDFDKCTWRKMTCAKMVLGTYATAYAQTFGFHSCYATGWLGRFLEAPFGFDISLSGKCKFEHGDGGFKFGNVFSWISTGTLFEGSAGTFFQTDGGDGIVNTGGYLELNNQPNFIYSNIPDGGQARGVVHSGNFQYLSDPNAANTSFYDVILGDATGYCGGNSCNGGLYDDTGTVLGRFMMLPDQGVRLSKSGRDHRALPQGLIPAKNTLTATGTDLASAALVPARIVKITGGGLDAGVAMPFSSPAPNFATDYTVINSTGTRKRIYAQSSDLIGGAGFIAVEAGTTRRLVTITANQWDVL